MKDSLINISLVGKVTYVDKFPECRYCTEAARYVGWNIYGTVNYTCKQHFKKYGHGLGTGKGNKLLLVEAGKKEENLPLEVRTK